MDSPNIYNDKYRALWLLLRQAKDSMIRIREKELSKFSITPQQSAVLTYVKIAGKMATITTLAEWLVREPNVVSELTSRMEKKKLLVKRRDSANHSLVRIKLTKKGEQAYLNATTHRESIQRMMSKLSENECEQLKICLLKLRDEALNELGMKRPPYPKIDVQSQSSLELNDT